MQASTNRSRVLAVLLALAVGAPLIEWTAPASAQYGGITPNAPYDQSRRVARRTSRRTARRQDDVQDMYQQPAYPPQQPYPQQPYPQQPYPQQPYPAPQH